MLYPTVLFFFLQRAHDDLRHKGYGTIHTGFLPESSRLHSVVREWCECKRVSPSSYRSSRGEMKMLSVCTSPVGVMKENGACVLSCRSCVVEVNAASQVKDCSNGSSNVCRGSEIRSHLQVTGLSR